MNEETTECTGTPIHLAVRVKYVVHHRQVGVYPITEPELERLASRWTSAASRKRIVDAILEECREIGT